MRDMKVIGAGQPLTFNFLALTASTARRQSVMSDGACSGSMQDRLRAASWCGTPPTEH